LTYSQVWDLESIFPGGSGSAELQSRLEFLELRHAEVKQQFDALAIPDGADSLDAWVAALQSRMDLFRVAGEAGSFVGCLMSQDVSDTQAKLISGRLSQLGASFAGIEIALRERIRQVPDETWSHLLADARIQPIAFQLQEIREDVDEMLSPD
jgi:oligoendopeptidase F